MISATLICGALSVTIDVLSPSVVVSFTSPNSKTTLKILLRMRRSQYAKNAVNCDSWGAYIWQEALKFQYFSQKVSTPYETDHLRLDDLSISSYSVSAYLKRSPQQVLISTILYPLHDSWTSLLMNLNKISNKRQVTFLFPKSDQWMTITPLVTKHFVTNQFVYSHHFSMLSVRICMFRTSAN